MDIKKIKSIVNEDLLDNETKRLMILKSMIDDEFVIPDILKMLEEERKDKKEILIETNLLLSKAHVGLMTPKMNKEGFIQDQITEHYMKYKGKIGHCFINLDTPHESQSDKQIKDSKDDKENPFGNIR